MNKQLKVLTAASILTVVLVSVSSVAQAEDIPFLIKKASQARIRYDAANTEFMRLSGEYFEKECPKNYYDNACGDRTRSRADDATGLSQVGDKYRALCKKIAKAYAANSINLKTEYKYELNEACDCGEEGSNSEISKCLQERYL